MASVSSRCTPRSASASGARPHRSASRAVDVRGFGARRPLGCGERRLRLPSAAVSAAQIGRRRRSPAASPLRFDELGVEAVPRARSCSRSAVCSCVAPGRQVGERAGQFGEGLFRDRERGFGGGDALRFTPRKPRVVRLRFGARGFFARRRAAPAPPARRRPAAVRVRGRGELHDAAVEFADAFLGARFFASSVSRRSPAAAARRRLWLRPRAGRAGRRRVRLAGSRPAACALVRSATTRTASSLRVRPRRLHLGADPAQVKQQRFGAAHLAGNVAVAHRLARLRFQASTCVANCPMHVFEAGQILLGGLEPQFGLVSARMQAGNAGGFFEHAAALLGLAPG